METTGVMLMYYFELNGYRYQTTEDGFIIDYYDWNKNVAVYIAKRQGIDELTKVHWKIIFAVRKFYEEYGFSPMSRNFSNAIRKVVGTEMSKTDYVHILFPAGASDVAKIAGIPRPTNNR
ncbi:TusE/DsrC/DsvC family sulfur relay protein [Patescibacteria group bacterium]|nr:TusE/DsrC/DsvC family sulfur relay protein [Patescibacteria group bacterium]